MKLYNSCTLPVSMTLFGGWRSLLVMYIATASTIVDLMDKAAIMIKWLLKYHLLLGERGLRYAVRYLTMMTPVHWFEWGNSTSHKSDARRLHPSTCVPKVYCKCFCSYMCCGCCILVKVEVVSIQLLCKPIFLLVRWYTSGLYWHHGPLVAHTVVCCEPKARLIDSIRLPLLQ